MDFEIKSNAERLEYSTVRIFCNRGQSVGTGFFFDFTWEDDYYVPVIVTNKHVIDGMTEAVLVFHTIDKNSGEHEKKTEITYHNIQANIVRHPKPDIDLCVLFLGPILSTFSDAGKEIIRTAFLEDQIFKKNGPITPFNNLSSIETVHMTGYPNSLWDSVNNKPITRRGITASNIRDDWQGQPDFMIDMACFPGSSGSPVYVFDEGSFLSGNSVVSSNGGRLLLLGILHKGPVFRADGEIHIVNIPTNSKPVVKTEVMMNLGIIVRAEMLLDIKPIIRGLIDKT